VGNNIFWSEIGSGFGDAGSTPPPKIPTSTPPPDFLEVLPPSVDVYRFMYKHRSDHHVLFCHNPSSQLAIDGLSCLKLMHVVVENFNSGKN